MLEAKYIRKGWNWFFFSLFLSLSFRFYETEYHIYRITFLLVPHTLSIHGSIIYVAKPAFLTKMKKKNQVKRRRSKKRNHHMAGNENFVIDTVIVQQNLRFIGSSFNVKVQL